ncbi:MAG TPA: hypothetical protein VJ931_18560, partial [Actinomycetota bacterium]|nr:hypothetical protein [Actinomycetota bacterium]
LSGGARCQADWERSTRPTMPPRYQAHITNFPEPLWVMNRDGISLREVVPPTLSKARSAEPMRLSGSYRSKGTATSL